MRSPASVHRIVVAVSALLPAMLLPALVFADDAAGFDAAIAEGNLVVAIALTFGAGILTSLTPCVYPMIPITVAVFGAQKTTKLRGFLLSLAFVEGIAAMFTALGVIAAASGNVFGAALSSPWVVGTIAALFIAMAASMFGAFELSLPSSLQTRLAGVGGAGYFGAFLMGIVAGVIASPCTGPVLTSILALVAASGRIGLGALLLFTFAHGLGLLFLLVGTFAASLPKPGRWMEAVKSVFGIVFVVAAAWFLAPQLPALLGWVRPGGLFLLAALGTFALGLALGAVHLTFGSGSSAAARKAAGIALCIVGLLGTVGWFSRPAPASAGPARGLSEGFRWIDDEGKGIAQARARKKPAVLDFTASWCGACGELARDTFPAPPVVAEASRFVAIRVDSTTMDDRVRALHTKYEVRGLPTVILLDSRGREERRITGFVPPDRFARMLRKVR